jgi:hypothetical protein
MLEPTTLAFYKGTDELEDRLVQWWTKGPYSHCEIIISENSYSSSARDGGVRRKQIVYDPTHWDFVQIHLDQLACLKWFIDHNGQKYDYVGLAGFVVPWRTNQVNRWFCSEALATILEIPQPFQLSPSALFMELFIHERFQAKFSYRGYTPLTASLVPASSF